MDNNCRKLTKDEQKQVHVILAKELKNQGYSNVAIAQKLRISESKVRRVLKLNGDETLVRSILLGSSD